MQNMPENRINSGQTDRRTLKRNNQPGVDTIMGISHAAITTPATAPAGFSIARNYFIYVVII